MTSTPETTAPRSGGSAQPPPSDLAAASRVRTSVQTVISGKPETVQTALTVLLAGGHLLVEDVPGVGKTMLAKSLARSLGCSVRRIQFTPDLLPSDVVGVNVYNRDTRDFEFKPGAIFANIVVGDEINRASPKTQSALLECMEEGQVTVDGTTYLLGQPFMVIATQNPAEMEGTYPLPEAQRDRFMACVNMGYPDRNSEIALLESHGADDPLESITAVTDATEVREMIEAVRRVHVSPALHAYIVDLVATTRTSPRVRLGASPRSALHLVRAARASAALAGRSYALPDDVQRLAGPVLAHRLLLSTDAHLARITPAAVVAETVERVPVPAGP
ncbi:MAG: MoxR family ATPase [Actinobacteria bacterium]|nr:MoxR family ATPase [Actinomycetota bacterium]